MYSGHNYQNIHIWNCDEFGAQAGHNGGGCFLARKGIQIMHSVMPIRENGRVSYLASMHQVLAFPVFKYLRVGHLGKIL